MNFEIPKYKEPDFSLEKFVNSKDAEIGICEKDGVAPDNYHGTSMYPEYFKVNGEWKLAEDSRMDGTVVLRESGRIDVVEMRLLKAGDKVFLGRVDNGSEGIYLYPDGFTSDEEENGDQFAFRQGRSRETAFSKDYDNLYSLLDYEKENGNIVWVMGPAFAFDHDARHAMQALVENGYVNGLLAGNALGTHDLEAAYLKTALGQNIYTQESQVNGHYNHLDTLNAVRRSGSIHQFISEHKISDGIMYALDKTSTPFVLASSIRDDGPLPEVIPSAYDAQDAMRSIVRKATTIICLATQLHTIATGNMSPSFRVIDGEIRPLFIYTVDVSEFAINKLADRGSLSAVGIVANVQDFIVNVAKGVGVY
jgi:hypothetical protein